MVKIQKEKKARKPRTTQKQKQKQKQNQMMRGTKVPASSLDAKKSIAFPSHQQTQAVVVNINKPIRDRPKNTSIEKPPRAENKQPASISFSPVISMPSYHQGLTDQVRASSKLDELQALKAEVKSLTAKLQPKAELRGGGILGNIEASSIRYVGDHLDDVKIDQVNRPTQAEGYTVIEPLADQARRFFSERGQQQFSTRSPTERIDENILRAEEAKAEEAGSELGGSTPNFAGSEAGSILAPEEAVNRLESVLKESPFQPAINLDESLGGVSKKKGRPKKASTEGSNILSEPEAGRQITEPEEPLNLLARAIESSKRKELQKLAGLSGLSSSGSSQQLIDRLFRNGVDIPAEIESIPASAKGRKPKGKLEKDAP